MGPLAIDSCLANHRMISNGTFYGDNPLNAIFPLWSMQMLVVTLTSRSLQLLFKPFMVARASIDILASLLLGPSLLGRVAPRLMQTLFPPQSHLVLSVTGNFGLIYWSFLLGIQINVGSLSKSIDRRSVVLATVSLASSYVLASASTFGMNMVVPESRKSLVDPDIIGSYIGMPQISVMASTLLQHKALGSGFGKLAMTTGVVAQIMYASVLYLTLVLEPVPGKPWVPVSRVIIGSGFTIFLFGVSRLLAQRIKDKPKEFYMGIILLLTATSAMISDMLGLHITMGALLAGLVMPNGLLSATFIKKMEDITGLLVPLVLVSNGQSIDMSDVVNAPRAWTVSAILFLTYAGKLSIFTLLARSFDSSLKDSFLAGVLLNSKGVIDALFVGYLATSGETNEIGDAYLNLMLGIIVCNFFISAIVGLMHRPAVAPVNITHCCALQQLRPDTPFSILACLHDQHMVPTIIGLVESTNANPKSTIQLSALHLIRPREDTLMPESGDLVVSKTNHQHPIYVAFRNYQWRNQHVGVEYHTRLSPYSTMHEEVAKLAAQKTAAMIVIPFRKELSARESSNKIFRDICRSILATAPCSVGVLVNHGLMRTCTTAFQNVALVFFGGPDDREALALATRMAKQDGVRLTVRRFLPASQDGHKKLVMPDAISTDLKENNPAVVTGGQDREKVVDDYCISLFQMELAGKKTVSYEEKLVSNGLETVAALRQMNRAHHDLFIVGRHQMTGNSTMLAGMEEWSEYQELGLIGDFLASPDFSAMSVLVVQQHVWRRDNSTERRTKSHSYTIQISPETTLSCQETTNDQVNRWHWNLHNGF